MCLNPAFGILAEAFSECTLMLRVVDAETDGRFGQQAHYEPGDAFMAILQKQQTDERTQGGGQYTREKYRIVVSAEIELSAGDVVRRESDGLTVRLTANTRDGAAPTASTLQIAKADCERWEIP